MSSDQDVTEDNGKGTSGADETDIKKVEATKNIDPVINPELANKDNPKEPINEPPPDMTKPINRPPKNNFESRKSDESSKNTEKIENKPNELDFNKMSLNEKRSYYRCGKHYVTLDQILPWPDYVKDNVHWFTKSGFLERGAEFTAANDNENRKVSLWQGDITCLEIDAIVNAANNSLLGGGGVDGCIHRAAGRGLLEECVKLHGCETGSAKITSGHELPAKHVIHTVGPIGEKKELLESCYISCLTLMKEHKLSSMAFCSISTGIYGYPNIKAAPVALKTVKIWLENNKDWVGRIIFCVFSQDQLEVYQQLMLQYFPCTVEKKKENCEESGDDTMAKKDVTCCRE